MLRVLALSVLFALSPVSVRASRAGSQPSALHALCIARFVADLPFTQACPPERFTYYDANGDGSVNARDVRCELDLTAGLPCVPPVTRR